MGYMDYLWNAIYKNQQAIEGILKRGAGDNGAVTSQAEDTGQTASGDLVRELAEVIKRG